MNVMSAHAFTSNHRDQLVLSDVCRCFYCLETFFPAEIEERTDEGGTAICPKCGVYAVIGSASGVPLDTAFFQQMHQHWF